MFDEGASNVHKHLVIYAKQEQQLSYSTFYKFHNNTNRDYWDLSEQPKPNTIVLKTIIPSKKVMTLKSPAKKK